MNKRISEWRMANQRIQQNREFSYRTLFHKWTGNAARGGLQSPGAPCRVLRSTVSGG